MFLLVSVFEVNGIKHEPKVLGQAKRLPKPGLQGGHGVWGGVGWGCVSVKFEWGEVGWKIFIFEK